VDGVTAAGDLYVVNVSGTFQNDEALTDGSTGSATANGVCAAEDDIVLTDSGGTTRYVLNTDYGLDEKSGTVFYLSGGSISAEESLKAYFDYATLSETVIQTGASGVDHYQVEVLPFGDSNENRYEFVFWKCSVKLDTDIPLITEGDEPVQVSLTMTPLPDGPGASTNEPVFRQIEHQGS